MTEFGPALLLLVMCFIIPMSNLSVMLMRYALAADMVQKQVSELALCDKFSQAYSSFYSEGKYTIKATGTTVAQREIRLEMTRLANRESQSVSEPRHFRSVWLPDGAKAPCNYELVVKQQMQISPLFCMNLPGLAVPGLTRPLPITCESRARWQNLTRDPATGSFYLNE